MDRLAAMRVFIEIVDRGTMSSASDALRMSKAMTSRYLESLEEWLGARLLHRTTRRLALTEAGEQAVTTFREMLRLADDVAAATSQSGAEVRGNLRVTTTPSFAQARLTEALVGFQRVHPGVEIDLVVLDRSVNLVEDRIDLAVRISNRVDPGLVSRRLAACRSLLCASASYLERAGVPAKPDDLRQHSCIVHSTGFNPEYVLSADGHRTVVPIRGVMAGNETSVVRAAALSGAGIAMLPTYYVGEDIMAGRLVPLLVTYSLEILNIQALYLSRRHQPKCLKLLIEHLATTFGGELPSWDLPLGEFISAQSGF